MGAPSAPMPRRDGLEKRRNSKGETDRKADITQIKKRRMDGEADILKDRVEIAAFHGSRENAGEGIGRENDECEKGGANPALHGQNIGTQRFRQIAGKGCNQRAEKGEDEHPEQHGAFMIAPDTGDLVEKRLLRMGVLDHVKDREIGNDIGVDQSGGCQNDQSEDCKRRWHGHCHQLRITAMRADHRHDGLNNRQRKRQHQSKMADLDTHMQSPRPVICPPIRPFSSGCRQDLWEHSSRHAWQAHYQRGTGHRSRNALPPPRPAPHGTDQAECLQTPLSRS